jgi:excisionase family DNA binding protein
MSEICHVLTVKEAAALMRVGSATIRRWCRLGYIGAVQVGSGATIRIPSRELSRPLDRRRD